MADLMLLMVPYDAPALNFSVKKARTLGSSASKGFWFSLLQKSNHCFKAELYSLMVLSAKEAVRMSMVSSLYFCFLYASLRALLQLTKVAGIAGEGSSCKEIREVHLMVEIPAYYYLEV